MLLNGCLNNSGSIPPTVIRSAGAAARPRESCHPHGRSLAVLYLIMFAYLVCESKAKAKHDPTHKKHCQVQSQGVKNCSEQKAYPTTGYTHSGSIVPCDRRGYKRRNQTGKVQGRGFNNQFWKRSDQCTETVERVNNCGRPRDVPSRLDYVSIYRHVIPHRAETFGRVSLSPLRIQGRASGSGGVRKFSSSSASKLSSSSSLLDLSSSEEVDQGEIPVPALAIVAPTQVPATAPILVVSSYSEVADNLNFPPVPPMPRAIGQKKLKAVDPPLDVQIPPSIQDPILTLPDTTEADSSLPDSHLLRKHKGKAPNMGRSKRKKRGGTESSIGTLTPFNTPELWNPKFVAVELRRPSCSRRMCQTLLQKRAIVNSKRMKKYSSKALKKANTLEFDLKKSRDKLVVEEATHKASDDATTKSKLEVDYTQPAYPDSRGCGSMLLNLTKDGTSECIITTWSLVGRDTDATQETLHKALQDLAELQRVDISPWTTTAPKVELPNFTKAYSSLILPSFNEEEYINQPTEEGNEGIAEVDGADKGNELGTREGGDQTSPRSDLRARYSDSLLVPY
ncbi:sugar transporter protein 7 [Actinidia rufa]|uniref:Sugar transporter protein 7 n=1 Tax=Actinidia rufa TaxID=165716 RepID=A0A7J0E3G3_9ERIC|nr:sugar transporter protein 7 [Actinidia rufa]